MRTAHRDRQTAHRDRRWAGCETFEVVPAPTAETPQMKTVRIQGLYGAAITAGMPEDEVPATSSEDDKLNKIKTE